MTVAGPSSSRTRRVTWQRHSARPQWRQVWQRGLRTWRTWRSWPRLLCLALSVIPIAALATVCVVLLVGTVRAFATVGAERLLAPDIFIGNTVAARRYGVTAPVWGTMLVAVEALVIALPASLAIAFAAREYPIGAVSRVLGGALGVL